MKAPTPTLPPPDPLVAQAQQTAQTNLLSGLQTQARSDTASLMAQYGAMSSAYGAGSPSAALTGALPAAGKAA
jgi:hypothetical protein